jgi:chromosome segregation ATPase
LEIVVIYLLINFSDESHNQRKNEMSKLSQSIAKLRDEEQELVNSSQDLRSNQNSLTESRVRLQEENRNFSYVISTKAKDIERLNQSKSERLKRYGNKYPELVKRIEAAHRRGQFKVKPLGPIGNHIELKDYSCALAVELCLKGLIYAFCCDNMDDRQVLQSIMKQVFGNERMPSIITRKFGPLHDVRRHKVEGGNYKSLLELMTIKEEPIANCLIDQLRIEQILFIPDYKVAETLLINRSTAPKNCYQSYTADGCVMYPNTRDSDYKCYANNTNKKRANILMENIDQILDSLHSEINHLKEQRMECEQRLQLNKQQFDANNKELSSFDAKIKQTRQSLIKSDLRLKELQAIGDSPPVEISTLQEELDNHNRRKTQLEQQIENKKEERNVIHNSLEEKEKEMKAKKVDYEKLLNGRHPLKEQLEKIKNEIISRNQVLLKKEKQMNELKALKTEEENKLKFKESELENYERTAIEATEHPIQTNRSKKTILNEVKQLQQFLEEQENSIGNRDEIYAKYKELSAHYKRMKSEVDALQNHLRKLKVSLDLRRRGYIELRNFYSMMTKFFFLDVLRHKGFCGSLEIYHNEKNINGEIKKAKTLEIRVNPKYDENSGILSNSSSYSDTRSLSGGERSYSTVAFILALWESAQSPFKILDEVDVFMDMVTRKISLDAMIEFASQKSGKQYIFLSPLKLQTLPSPELIKIFQMPEPER